MKVSNAINILNSSIDTKICKQTMRTTADDEGKSAKGKCTNPTTSGSSKGLSKAFGDKYATSTAAVGQHTSNIVSKDTSELSREEKGVVSSVFAKVATQQDSTSEITVVY